MEKAVFGGGCFWCTEAIFQRLKGVTKVVSGYAGGKRENPSYEQVSTGATGHAEAVELTFDPAIISYEKLLQIFFATHDPTTRDRQGADVGSQYRSVIFYEDKAQEEKAESMINELNSSKKYKSPVVTQIEALDKFYTAEEYHQNYYNENKTINQYCSIVIDPKIEKLLQMFNNDVKEEYK